MEDKAKATIFEALSALAKNEIRITRTHPEDPLCTISCRIGGYPDVPAGFVWPSYFDEDGDDLSLTFIAQFDLSSLSEFDADGLLPKAGVLSFFYDTLNMPWGFKPADKDSARVLYFPDAAVLSPAKPPEGTDVLPEFALKFEKHISLPCYEEFEDAAGVAGIDFDLFDSCVEMLGYEQDGLCGPTKLLGYADVIQAPMQEDCERIARGHSCGSPEDYAAVPEEEETDIAVHAADWMLLFQLGSIEEDDFELLFGDLGNIYFWIRREDLAARRFERCLLMLQCG